MRADGELKDLRNREQKAVKALLKLADECVPVLTEDIAKYPAREIRHRFVEDPIFADSLDDATLKRLKSELEERSTQVRDRIMELVDQEGNWLAGLECDGPGKSFAENQKLWAPTTAAAELVREILSAYGFPDTAPSPEYRMPTWFINGKYLPGIAEKYWGLIAEIREIRVRIREVERDSQRETLRKRWDSI